MAEWYPAQRTVLPTASAQPRLPGDGHRLREAHRGLHDVAALVGVAAGRGGLELHAAHHRRVFILAHTVDRGGPACRPRFPDRAPRRCRPRPGWCRRSGSAPPSATLRAPAVAVADHVVKAHHLQPGRRVHRGTPGAADGQREPRRTRRRHRLAEPHLHGNRLPEHVGAALLRRGGDGDAADRRRRGIAQARVDQVARSVRDRVAAEPEPRGIALAVADGAAVQAQRAVRDADAVVVAGRCPARGSGTTACCRSSARTRHSAWRCRRSVPGAANRLP